MDLNENKIEDIKIGKIKYLMNADLRGANLKYADLRCANLRYANLTEAGLRGADLRGADLREVDLRDVDLKYADLKYADLSNANLRYVDLKYADLRYANLTEADLRYTDLKYADLRGANLTNTKSNFKTEGYNIACPEKGSFVAYKKSKNCLIELLILEDSKRSSATTLKCRCDKAKVLEITNIKTGEKINNVSSEFDKDFVYTVGEIVKVDDFDNNRWNECSTGIHFFINKANAINYK